MFYSWHMIRNSEISSHYVPLAFVLQSLSPLLVCVPSYQIKHKVFSVKNSTEYYITRVSDQEEST